MNRPPPSENTHCMAPNNNGTSNGKSMAHAILFWEAETFFFISLLICWGSKLPSALLSNTPLLLVLHPHQDVLSSSNMTHNEETIILECLARVWWYPACWQRDWDQYSVPDGWRRVALRLAASCLYEEIGVRLVIFCNKNNPEHKQENETLCTYLAIT